MLFIYCILNKENGKVYIGQTSKDPDKAWKVRRRELRNNNYHNPYLQNAWNKHGENSFEFFILDSTESQEYLNELEETYRKWYDDLGLAYNIVPGGTKPPTLVGKDNPNYGKIFSEETRRRIGESSKGRESWFKGKTHSEETKQKIREARAKQVITGETAEKISNHHKLTGLRPPDPTGTTWTEERRKKVQETWERKRNKDV